ncbi:hypothetical protein CRUP_032430 [Coryphaenoides rupestris]|nr:hypothetical protein CRUP_032430 [Coryphaenoides rupestris]
MSRFPPRDTHSVAQSPGERSPSLSYLRDCFLRCQASVTITLECDRHDTTANQSPGAQQVERGRRALAVVGMVGMRRTRARPSPCLHGGRCLQEGDSYSCYCPQGFSRGESCEIGESRRADRPGVKPHTAKVKPHVPPRERVTKRRMLGRFDGQVVSVLAGWPFGWTEPSRVPASQETRDEEVVVMVVVVVVVVVVVMRGRGGEGEEEEEKRRRRRRRRRRREEEEKEEEGGGRKKKEEKGGGGGRRKEDEEEEGEAEEEKKEEEEGGGGRKEEGGGGGGKEGGGGGGGGA